MITEKVYRDLGAAVVRAFIKSEKFDGAYSTIRVFMQRTDANEGRIAFFVGEAIYPTAWLSTAELKAIALSSKHIKKREEEEE